MSKAKDTFWPMVLSLVLISMISGGVLALVYNLTKEPIEQSKKLSFENSVKSILPPFTLLQDTIVNNIPVIIAYNDSDIAGYAITAEGAGYGGPIKVMIGYTADGVINDYAILEHQETPGLGAKAGEWFKKTIPGGNANTTYSVSKDGGNVDGITAATITSRAFLKSVNDANKTFIAVTDSTNTVHDGVSGATKTEWKENSNE